MNSRPIHYDDGVIQADLVVTQANLRMGLARTRLQVQGEDATQAETDPDLLILRTYNYPDMIAATTGTLTIDGQQVAWPPSFEVFINLPDKLGGVWERAVYELNGHWLPEKVDEKKASSSSGH